MAYSKLGVVLEVLGLCLITDNNIIVTLLTLSPHDVTDLIFHSSSSVLIFILVTQRTTVKRFTVFLEQYYVLSMICNFKEVYCKTGIVQHILI